MTSKSLIKTLTKEKCFQIRENDFLNILMTLSRQKSVNCWPIIGDIVRMTANSTELSAYEDLQEFRLLLKLIKQSTESTGMVCSMIGELMERSPKIFEHSSYLYKTFGFRSLSDDARNYCEPFTQYGGALTLVELFVAYHTAHA